MATLSSQHLRVYRWDLDRARTRTPLQVLFEGRVDLPTSHDTARDEAKRRAVSLAKGGRVKSCSALVEGGFAVVVDTKE